MTHLFEIVYQSPRFELVISYLLNKHINQLRHDTMVSNQKQNNWAKQGFEPQTSYTKSKNHTPLPLGLRIWQPMPIQNLNSTELVQTLIHRINHETKVADSG